MIHNLGSGAIPADQVQPAAAFVVAAVGETTILIGPVGLDGKPDFYSVHLEDAVVLRDALTLTISEHLERPTHHV